MVVTLEDLQGTMTPETKIPENNINHDPPSSIINANGGHTIRPLSTVNHHVVS